MAVMTQSPYRRDPPRHPPPACLSSAASAHGIWPRSRCGHGPGLIRTVAIVPGHSPDAPGAHACDGASEHDTMSQLATQVVAALLEMGVPAQLHLRPGADVQGYAAKMSRLVGKINASQSRAAIELHWNSVPRDHPYWSGVTALYWPGSRPGLELARELAAHAAQAIGLVALTLHGQARSWQQSVTGPDGRPVPAGPPLYFLRDTACPAALVELGNCRNAGDLAALRADIASGSLARALAQAVSAWLETHP